VLKSLNLVRLDLLLILERTVEYPRELHLKGLSKRGVSFLSPAVMGGEKGVQRMLLKPIFRVALITLSRKLANGDDGGLG